MTRQPSSRGCMMATITSREAVMPMKRALLVAVAAISLAAGCSGDDGNPEPAETGGMSLPEPSASESVEPALDASGEPATVVDEFLIFWNSGTPDNQQATCEAYDADPAAVLDELEAQWVPDPHAWDREAIELAFLGVCY